MKNSILVIFFLLTVGSSQAQSLDYFIDLAKENQPALQAERLRNQAIKTKENQYSAWQDPTISAGYNLTPNSMERMNASVMQNFAWFGTASKQKEAARKETESSIFSLEAQENQVAVGVSNLYFDLQELMLQKELQKEMRDTYASLEVLATNKLATTKGSMVDVARAELEKDKTVIAIELIDLKIINLKEALNRIVLRDPKAVIEIIPIQKFALIQEMNVEEHPELKAIQAKQEEMELLTIVAKKEAAPQLGIGLDYMQMNPTHHEFMPMLSLSIPIYRKKYKAKIEESSYLQKAYHMEKDQLRMEHYRARTAVKNELQQVEKERILYENQLLKLAKAKDLLLTYYSTVGSDFEEVLRLQQEENTYKNDLITNQTTYLKLNKQWEYLNLISQ